MTGLAIESRLDDPDAFYETLIDAHRDLSPDESSLFNCKLILLLANHIGSAAILADALCRAHDGIREAGPTRLPTEDPA